MTFGFNIHIVCGRVGSIQERKVDGNTVVNVRILVKTGMRDSEPVWIEASMWGRQAENFKHSNFKRGDRLSVSMSSLRQYFWEDAQGRTRSNLIGNADKFWDLRSGPHEESRLEKAYSKMEELDTAKEPEDSKKEDESNTPKP